jgi:4-phospho-D-threonate 3-dehydrogenase / 4-phospho-D-erythronate 3-dehydrogenase
MVAAVSMGDPLGIGPEIILKALSDKNLRRLARYRVFGARWAMRRAPGGGMVEALEREGVEFVDVPGAERVVDGPSRPTAEGGEVSFRAVEAGAHEVRSGRASALVTAPISKASWALAGHGEYPGHTELLAEIFEAPRSGMVFVGPRFVVSLATVHVPLLEAVRDLTQEKVVLAIELAHGACVDAGIERPRIAAAGVNPHAGEAGLLGEEDDRVVKPAVEEARRRGIDASGPWAGDTVFARALKGEFDAVAAMYHDQGLIPVKLIDGDQAVNVTAGLPEGAVRTSPAHGTAFDIAGKGVAREASMVAAIERAVEMAGRRGGR